MIMDINDNGLFDPYRTVKGFCAAKEGELESLRDFYKLKMPNSKLRVIGAAFGKIEKRDPRLFELYFLDRLANAGELASNARICEVFSESATVGEAFDNLLRNVKVAGGYRLSDIAEAADKRLERVGKVPAEYRSEEKVRLICGGDEKFYCSPTSSPMPKTQGTYCFLSAKGTEFAGDRMNEVVRLFENINIPLLKRIGKGGMIAAMIATGKSAFVDIKGFDGTDEVQSLSVLTDEIPDSLILLVDPSDVTKLDRICADSGLFFRVVGRQSEAQRLTVVYGGGYPISFSLQVLRAMTDAGRIRVKIPEENKEVKAEKGFSVSLNGEEAEKFAGCFFCGGNVFTAVSVRNPDFLSSAKGVIEAVGRLVAAGADYRKVSLSLNEHLGRNVDADLAMLLGIYRARTELCLTSLSNELTDSEEHSFTVFANSHVGSDMPIWDKVSERRRGKISVLPPRTGADGLPDMRDMRLLFEYVHGLIEDGKVLSAAFVGSEGAESAMAEMTCGEVVNVYENVPFGSFIVETEIQPDGIPIADRKLQINREN